MNQPPGKDETSVQISKQDIVTALKYNAEFFIQFFLGSYIHLPVPAFHPEIFALMVNEKIQQTSIAIPRDHAKTTLAKLATVYVLLFSKYRFGIYLSNTTSVSIPAANDIIKFLESDNCVAVFGEIEWFIKRDGEGLYKFRIPYNNKTCILRALGAKQQVIGINIDNKRPDFAIVDDLEDLENIATEYLLLQLARWFYGAFKKCLDKFDHKIIHIGNMRSEKCLLKKHCESEYWYSRIYGCIKENGEPLWPEAWSLQKLIQDYKEYQEVGLTDVWFAEMMNTPIAPGSSVININEIDYRPEIAPADGQYGFITVDLAISSKEWAHKTAVVVHMFVGDFWQIAETRKYHGINPITLFDEIVNLCLYWGINYVGIENTAFQASLKYVYQYLAKMNGIENLHFVPVHCFSNEKNKRIVTWTGLLKEKTRQYVLTHGDFNITNELIHYNPRNKDNTDDCIDSASYGPQMIENYLFDIQSASMSGQSQKTIVQGCYDVCSV